MTHPEIAKKEFDTHELAIDNIRLATQLEIISSKERFEAAASLSRAVHENNLLEQLDKLMAEHGLTYEP